MLTVINADINRTDNIVAGKIIIIIASWTKRKKSTQGVRKAEATVASLELATRRADLRAGGDRVVDGIVGDVVVDSDSS